MTSIAVEKKIGVKDRIAAEKGLSRKKVNSTENSVKENKAVKGLEKAKGSQSIITTIHNTLKQNQIIFLALSCIYLVITGFSLWNLKQIQNENITVKEIIYQLEADNLKELNNVYKMCLVSDTELWNSYEEESVQYDTEIQDYIKQLRKLIPNEEAALVEIQDILQSALEERRQAVTNSSLAGNSGKALVILEEEYSPKMEQISELCTELSNRIMLESQNRIKRSAIVMVVTGIAVVLAAVFMMISAAWQKRKMNRLINVPINEILTAMEELEKGNLAYESSYHSDNEMGILMDCVRKTVSTLRGYIGNIEQVLLSLSEKKYDIQNNYEYKGDFIRISDALNVIIEELNETVADISDGIKIVGCTGEKVKDTAVSLARDTNDNAATIEELSASVEEIVHHVSQILERMDKINAEEKEITEWIEQCHKEMDCLEQDMEQTVKVTEYLEQFMFEMDNITKEINMLSLNASIEAARAGDFGKGFAVVAEEVRSLSNQTVEVTSQSREYIQNCTTAVTKGMDEIRKTSKEMTEIAVKVHKIKDMVKETSEVSHTQLGIMQNFEDAVVDMSLNVQNDSGIANTLEKQAEDMDISVEKISSKMQEFVIWQRA